MLLSYFSTCKHILQVTDSCVLYDMIWYDDMI